LKMNRKPLLCLFSCFIFLFVLLLSVNSEAVTAQYVLIDDYAGTTVPNGYFPYGKLSIRANRTMKFLIYGIDLKRLSSGIAMA